MPRQPHLSRSQNNYYADSGLDRAAQLRSDADWLKAQLAGPDSRLVPVWRSRNLFAVGDPPEVEPVAILLEAAKNDHLLEMSAETVFLGVEGKQSFFAVDLSHLDDPEDIPGLGAPGEFLDLRFAGHHLRPEHGAMLAYARGMLTWHRRHRFCGTCGTATEVKDAGHLRVCSNEQCAVSHFPRTDPAVIMLVTKGDKCILGRQRQWPPGMFSTLAGFVEPGETLEAAVAREVYEESAVEVTDVRFHSSQPWPFPTSLMLGFYATAVNDDVRVNDHELEDARWFERDWILKNEGSEDFRLPRRDSIARRLIEDWLAEG